MSRTYIVGTLMLWVASFMGLVIIYGFINWMPVLLKGANIDAQSAALISTLFPLGGIGAVFSGVLMDRFRPSLVIAGCYAVSTLGVFCIGQVVGSTGLLVVAVFATGVLLNTSQSSMPALAASFYPTEGRATGVAWMLGISRFGGIAGSFLIAELSRLQFTFAGIFASLAVAGVIASVALLASQTAESRFRIRNRENSRAQSPG